MKKRDKKGVNRLFVKNKKAIAIEGLVWWVIAIAVLVIMVILAVILKDKLGNIGSYIKNLFRFRLLNLLIN